MTSSERRILIKEREFIDQHQDAAVMLITDLKSVLLIIRNIREGDPWSGQIALPGGFRKSGEDLGSTAESDTEEEVNVNLHAEGYIGTYPTIHGKKMVGVFYCVVDSRPSAKPGDEVSEVHWVSISDFTMSTMENGFPSLDYYGGRVWGLTYRILTSVMTEE